MIRIQEFFNNGENVFGGNANFTFLHGSIFLGSTNLFQQAAGSKIVPRMGTCHNVIKGVAKMTL